MIRNLTLQSPTTRRRLPPLPSIHPPTPQTEPESENNDNNNNDYSHGSSSSFEWNVRLRELARAGRHGAALALYRRMRLAPGGPPPDGFTFPSVLASCAALSLPSAGAQLHSHIIRAGCLPDPFVLTALIAMYWRLSLLPLARRLFDEIPTSTHPSTLAVCYNAVISGYALHGLASDALSLFRRMVRSAVPFNTITMLALVPACPRSLQPLHACNVKHGTDKDVSVANCLLTTYARLVDVGSARRVFDGMAKTKELITWNAMISAYAQNGLADCVLELYNEMKQFSNVEPDPVTLVGVLSACANLGARVVGHDIDRYISTKPLFDSNIFLKNALINMHARCGDLARAREIFDGMKEKTVISWTAIIAGYGMHGCGEVAVQLFDSMQADRIQPDGVAMVSVLSACSHAGLTQKGLQYFWDMESVYGVVPRPEHYACMVDLLGRAGQLKDAWELIESMLVEPDGAIWGALLSACKIHKNVELGEVAFEHVIELEPTNVGYYVLMSNIYLDARMLDDVRRIRAMMRQRGLRKDPGCSYMEHKKRVHLFMADDHSHSQSKSIYQMVEKLEAMVREECGVMEDGKDKKDASEEERNTTIIGVHSEKLAIAFGLLNTEVGTDIVVIKNLRVCEDCHAFINLVSKIVSRKLVVRDASRFHHFEGGICSCNGYW